MITARLTIHLFEAHFIRDGFCRKRFLMPTLVFVSCGSREMHPRDKERYDGIGFMFGLAIANWSARSHV
jgi:hypothetical protein